MKRIEATMIFAERVYTVLGNESHWHAAKYLHKSVRAEFRELVKHARGG